MQTFSTDHDAVFWTADDGDWVPAHVARGLYDALDRIAKSGSWYITALEIDIHEDGAMDGEELERMALDALATADKGE